MTAIQARNQLYWLLGLAAVLVVGNVGVFRLLQYLTRLNLGCVYLAPWLFLIIPLCGIAIAYRGKLYARSCRYRDATKALLVLYIAVWFFTVYVFLETVYPDLL